MCMAIMPRTWDSFPLRKLRRGNLQCASSLFIHRHSVPISKMWYCHGAISRYSHCDWNVYWLPEYHDNAGEFTGRRNMAERRIIYSIHFLWRWEYFDSRVYGLGSWFVVCGLLLRTRACFSFGLLLFQYANTLARQHANTSTHQHVNTLSNHASLVGHDTQPTCHIEYFTETHLRKHVTGSWTASAV